jgi:hypothetical protein
MSQETPEPGPARSGGADEPPEPVPSEDGQIGDDRLPDDLRPTEENPLAHPLPAGERSDLEVPGSAGPGQDADDAGDDEDEDGDPD